MFFHIENLESDPLDEERQDQRIEALRLNMRASLALAGAYDAPERELATLLRSGLEIFPETRAELADALSGKSKVVGLRANGLAKTKVFRSVQSRVQSVKQARSVAALQKEGKSFDDAVGAVALDAGRSRSSIEASFTFARKMDRWVSEWIAKEGSSVGADIERLSDIYVIADTLRRDPVELLHDVCRDHRLPEGLEGIPWGANDP